MVLDRRQPRHDSYGKCSIGKSPSAPLRNTHHLVRKLESTFRQKVWNFDNLLPRHPFLASEQFSDATAIRQDTMGKQRAPAIEHHQFRPRYLVPPSTTGDNETPAENTSPRHGENIAVDVV